MGIRHSVFKTQNKISQGLRGKILSYISRFFKCLFQSRKNRARPILPLVNPLLEETRLISSSGFGSSEETSVVSDGIIDLEAQQNIPCFEQSSEKKKKKKNVRAGSDGIIDLEAQENVHCFEHSEKKKRKKKKNVRVDSEGIRWIKHYSSRHRILVVGEGDFSFSASLAMAFSLASNMIATSLDSQGFLRKNYEKSLANIEELRNRECKVMHEIDATTIANHAFLRLMKFDHIIFNFPFAGFFRNLSPESQLKRHRRLVSLFLKNAKQMINEDGEIHISHKTNGDHSKWNIESMASSHGLRLIEAVNFKLHHYPGYNTKYGFGGDGNFNCYPSKTFKFGLKIAVNDNP